MRRICSILLLASTTLLITGAGVRAQDAPQKPPDLEQAIKITLERAVGEFNLQLATSGMLGAIVTGAPYSAVTVNEATQTLADGNRIVHKSTYNVSRDTQGRVRREELDENEVVTSVMILDPVANASYVLDPASRTARKVALLMPKQVLVAPTVQFHTEVLPSGAGEEPKQKIAPRGVVITATTSGATAGGIVAKERADIRQESLGTEVIEGVAAEGTRTTRTIPAGQIGNERPIDIVSEQWYSKELQMTVSSRQSDPRTGETVYRVTNLRRGEPDAFLFQVPADYTVKLEAVSVKTTIK